MNKNMLFTLLLSFVLGSLIGYVCLISGIPFLVALIVAGLAGFVVGELDPFNAKEQ